MPSSLAAVGRDGSPDTDRRRLSILLLCYEYPPLGGGGGVGAKSYAEAWAAKSHRVLVVTGGGADLPSREMISEVDVVRVRHFGKKDRATSTGLSMLSYVMFGITFVLKNRAELRTFDIVNTHFSLPTGPLGWLAARLLSLPHVLTIIGGDIYDPTKPGSPHRRFYWRAVNRFLINSADRVIAISSDTERRAREHYRIGRPIEVINYGFSPRDRIPEPALPREAGSFELIAVGRLVERKGFVYLIEALAQLPDSIRLSIIGDGPLGSQLEEAASRMQVADRVSFLGYAPREDIDARLRRADCFVLSSLHEGLGIVVQEAMAAGLPVVATDNGGQVDLIRPGRNGILVPVADADALARAIRRIHDDPTLGETFRRNNLEDIRRCFMESNCEEYLRLFREVTSEIR